jgi:hypothetical protein
MYPMAISYTKWLSNTPNVRKIYQYFYVFFLVQHIKTGKMYSMPIRYKKWLSKIPNGHNLYQYFPFLGPPKCTQRGFKNIPSGNPGDNI